MDSNPRMKEMFIELEQMIEEGFGAHRQVTKQVKTYKGTTKKWQILDDECFSRDQIEKLQSSVNAPSAVQLEKW